MFTLRLGDAGQINKIETPHDFATYKIAVSDADACMCLKRTIVRQKDALRASAQGLENIFCCRIAWQGFA